MITEFDKYKKLQNKADQQLGVILGLINDFIIYDDGVKKNHDIILNERNIFNANHYEEVDNTIEIWYYYDKYLKGSVTSVTLTSEEYDRLLKFMENPQLYKSTSKFNV